MSAASGVYYSKDVLLAKGVAERSLGTARGQERRGRWRIRGRRRGGGTSMVSAKFGAPRKPAPPRERYLVGGRPGEGSSPGTGSLR